MCANKWNRCGGAPRAFVEKKINFITKRLCKKTQREREEARMKKKSLGRYTDIHTHILVGNDTSERE